jgi:hypothetical protein
MPTKTHLITSTFEAPAHWASALINGDLSGLDYHGAACVAEFEAWATANPKHVVDCSSEPHIGRWNGLQTELLTYTEHTHVTDYEPCGQCGFDHAYEQSEAREWHFKKPEHSEE